MAGQPLRRSPRQAAEVKADFTSIVEDTIASTSKSRSRRSSMSQVWRCSLQSLDDQSQSPCGGLIVTEETADANESQLHRWSANHDPSLKPTTKPVASIPRDFPVGGRVSVIETHSKHRGRAGTVRRHTNKFVVVALGDNANNNEEIRISPNFLRMIHGDSSGVMPSLIDFKRVSTVRFDLRRNSIAKYDKEAPSNIVSKCLYSSDTAPIFVEHMPDEIDDVTHRNKEILAEWDGHFDENFNLDERRKMILLVYL